MELLHHLSKCPNCLGDLGKTNDHLECGRCGIRYPLFLSVFPDFTSQNGLCSRSEVVERHNLDDQADRIHKRDWKQDGYNKERIDRCDKLLEGEVILDIGAADGQIASHLSKNHGRKIIALEKSTRWLTIHGEATVPFVFSDTYRLPFANDTFDSIFMGEVIEHLYDPKEAILQALRVLKIGGVIVGTTPNFAFWKKRILYLRGQFGECPSSPLNHEHIRFFNVNYLRGLLNDAKMRDIEIYGIWPNLSPEPNHVKPIKDILADKYTKLFAYTLLFKARKCLTP